jgi:hypothetical protein
MSHDEPEALIDYWDVVDAAMMKLFGVDTWDAGVELDLIAEAQENGDSPEEFAVWFGRSHGLTVLAQRRPT